MLVMKIKLDIKKIKNEGKYAEQAMYNTISSVFTQLQLLTTSEELDTIVCTGSNNERDYGRFGKAVNTLKKKQWFMDNVTFWRMYDSDDGLTPQDYSEEDLLSRYRLVSMGA